MVEKCTSLGVDLETATIIRDLADKHEKTKKAMLRQIVREWVEQEKMARDHFAEFKSKMQKMQRNLL